MRAGSFLSLTFISFLALFVLYAAMGNDLNAGEIIGIVIGVIVIVVLYVVICWKLKILEPFIARCCGDTQERSRLVKETPTKVVHELLIKRCEQTTTRTVENSIIHQSNLRRHNPQEWRQDVDDSLKPVVVFCVISSRIGTDIDSAMRGVNDNSQVILVLLHFKNKSQLRGELKDDEYLLGSETMQRFAGIAHFAFSEHENLYSCTQNSKGFTKLNQLLSKLARVPAIP